MNSSSANSSSSRAGVKMQMMGESHGDELPTQAAWAFHRWFILLLSLLLCILLLNMGKKEERQDGGNAVASALEKEEAKPPVSIGKESPIGDSQEADYQARKSQVDTTSQPLAEKASGVIVIPNKMEYQQGEGNVASVVLHLKTEGGELEYKLEGQNEKKKVDGRGIEIPLEGVPLSKTTDNKTIGCIKDYYLKDESVYELKKDEGKDWNKKNFPNGLYYIEYEVVKNDSFYKIYRIW